MVYLKRYEECNCRTCKGSEFKEDKFGGMYCLCKCHTLEGKEREDFIADKEEFLKNNKEKRKEEYE